MLQLKQKRKGEKKVFTKKQSYNFLLLFHIRTEKGTSPVLLRNYTAIKRVPPTGTAADDGFHQNPAQIRIKALDFHQRLRCFGASRMPQESPRLGAISSLPRQKMVKAR